MKKKLTKKEEFDLLVSYNLTKSTDTLNELVICNLQNVKNLSYNFYKKNNYLPLDELISIGNEVLLKVIMNFNVESGNRIYTYLRTSCINDFSRAININSPVKLPDNKYITLGKVSRGIIEVDNVNQKLLDLYGDRSSVRINNQIEEYKNANQIIDETYEENSINQELEDDIQFLFKFLTEEEIFIIKEFYGMGDGDQLNLSEISEHLGISKSEVSKRKKEVLEKLKIIHLTYLS